MDVSILKLITLIIPRQFLPSGHNMVDGKRIPLNIQERREFLERNLIHKKEQFLNKVSPARHLSRLYEKRRLENAQKKFYSLIGEITLLHAGIEQDLKNTLLYEWDVPEEERVEKLYGKQLREKFLKAIKNRLIPDDMYQEYSNLLEEFKDLSYRRNDTVKALYGFNSETAEGSKINEKYIRKINPNISFEERVKAWMPKIDMDDITSLKNDLAKLRGNLLQIRIKVQRDKQKMFEGFFSVVGSSVPEYAFNNPYIYLKQK